MNTIRKELTTNYSLSRGITWQEENTNTSIYFKEPTSEYSTLVNIGHRLFIKVVAPAKNAPFSEFIDSMDISVPTTYEIGITGLMKTGASFNFSVTVEENMIDVLDYDDIESSLLRAFSSFNNINHTQGLLFDNSSSNLIVG